ncbi:MAG: glycosyltransferase [Jatrophihabitantaceae bacterium]
MIKAIGVVVPAVDEQMTIGDCLEALVVARAHARAANSRDIDVRILVVLDSCVDGTEAIVRSHRHVQSHVCLVGRVGAARAAGTQRLLSDIGVPLPHVWLANTDADSIVPPDWLTIQLEEANAGAQLILGTVQLGYGLPAAIEQAWLERHDQSEQHPHVHGANLGIRADVYSALGGWSAHQSGEDIDLARRASSSGDLQIVRTGRIPVRTSSRLVGRAPHGFAGYLRRLTLDSGDVAV